MQTRIDKTAEEIRTLVRQRYAAAAGAEAACCGPSCCREAQDEPAAFGAPLYSAEERESVPEATARTSLGCGNPTAVAELHEGEVVLDLGSGGGIDVLLSAKRVGPTGKAYGLDMTDEMLTLARASALSAGATNVEFVEGTIEDIPLADASVDVVISNCVVNLSPDKPRVFREAARVLRPGGRLAVTDILADPELDDAVRGDLEQWAGCIAGALTREELERELAAAGFVEIEVAETHRVHAQAGSAIVRARKPA